MSYISIVSVPRDSFVYVRGMESFGERIRAAAPTATIRETEIASYGTVACTVHATVNSDRRSELWVNAKRLGSTLAIAAIFHDDLHIAARDRGFGRKFIDEANRMSELAHGMERRVTVNHEQIARTGAMILFMLPTGHRARVVVDGGRPEVASYALLS